MTKSSYDPILSEDAKRFVMFPIRDSEIWEMYQKAEDSFWRVQEVDLTKDGWDSFTKKT